MTVLDSLIHREDMALIRREVECLPPQSRRVLELRFFDGLSLTEAGAKLTRGNGELGMTNEGARICEMRALLQLHAQLVACGVREPSSQIESYAGTCVRFKKQRASKRPRRRRASLYNQIMRKVIQSGPNGCWEWTGRMMFLSPQAQYPSFARTRMKVVNVVRWLWLRESEIKRRSRTVWLRRKCANPYCVNPAHIHALQSKGAKLGKRPGVAVRLGALRAADVRRRHAAGTPVWKLAEECGVGMEPIYRLLRQETYR